MFCITFLQITICNTNYINIITNYIMKKPNKILNHLKKQIQNEKKNNQIHAKITYIHKNTIHVSLKNPTNMPKNTQIITHHIKGIITKNNHKNLEIKLLKPHKFKLHDKIIIKNIQNEVITLKLEKIVSQIENNQLNEDNLETLQLLQTQINPEYNTNITYYNHKLNKNQNKAIKRSLQTSKFHLIQGPPGCGKTYTIVNLIKQLYKNKKKILICSHTHIAVDNVVEKLENIPDDAILRIGDKNKISQNNLKYTIDEHIKKEPEYMEIQKCKDKIDIIKNHSYKSSMTNDLSTINNNHESTLSRLFRKLLPTNNMTTNYINEVSYDENSIYELECKINNIENSLNDTIVRNVSIIATTVISASSFLIENVEFDYVIMDEASQVPLYLSLIALLKCEKFILIGDNMQLEPIHNNNTSMYLNKSIFTTLLMLYPDNFTFLNIQYRMNQEICDIASNLYYDGKLKTYDKIANKKISVDNSSIFVDDSPVVFIDTGGVSYNEARINRSCYNKFEAEVILSIIKNLIDNDIKCEDIGVISAYRCQKLYIKKLLEDNGINDVEVDTVYRFQGREKDVVILSFCKSNSGVLSRFESDFISNINQLNVSITRSHYKLIMIGDLDFLTHALNIKKLIYMLGSFNVIHLSDMF